MLKKLRSKKTAKKIWIILAILIVPAFVLWDSGSLIPSKEESAYLGTIFGKSISALEYKDALEAVRNAAIMRFGDKFSEVQKYLNLESQAWERLILLYEAKIQKIAASNREVIESIEGYPFFQRNGQFDNRIYSEMLQYVFRARPRIFEEQARQNLILSKLYQQITNNVKIDEKEIKEEYEKANEEISLTFIAGIPSDFIKGITPSEEDIKDYFTKNQLNFKQPLSFNLEYIVFDSEDKTKNAASLLNKNGDFNKTAKDLGVNVKETGLFSQADFIPGIGWYPEILNLISRLKVGQYSAPVHIDQAYYILRLKEKREANIPDFEKIKDKVKEAFLKDESSKLAKEKTEQALGELKETYKQNPKQIDFAKIAKTYGLKYDSTKSFKYGSYIEDIGASDNFWIKARALKGDEFSDTITMPSGFYIIKLKSRVEVDEKKFESEKKEFSQKLLLQKKQEYFVQFIEELKRRAQ
jgi:parvulin-like peptidyl-prolyl isomerase